MQFEIGKNAIVITEMQELFEQKCSNLIDAIQPANLLEKIFANQVVHAAWDLERARLYGSNLESAPLIHAAASRASRNFKRAYAELKLLQAARASRGSANQPPLSDVATLRKSRRPVRIAS